MKSDSFDSNASKSKSFKAIWLVGHRATVILLAKLLSVVDKLQPLQVYNVKFILSMQEISSIFK